MCKSVEYSTTRRHDGFQAATILIYGKGEKRKEKNASIIFESERDTHPQLRFRTRSEFNFEVRITILR